MSFELRTIEIEKVTDVEWCIPAQGPMRASIRIFGDEATVAEFKKELSHSAQWSSLRQLVNMTQLKGILSPVIAMADVHPGYGFPIGGIGVFDTREGMISVAGVGFDCNCGVRMLRTPLTRMDILSKAEECAQALYRGIPAGVGSEGDISLNTKELNRILVEGVPAVITRGMGIPDDLFFIEEGGALPGADPSCVSDKAKERQDKQIGTLGSGNHYLEVQCVDEIYDPEAAKAFGIEKDMILVSIHCGSRALGHQICTDYLRVLAQASQKYHLMLPDKELVGTPVMSDEGKQYRAALACAVNLAFANRQVLAHKARTILSDMFGIAYGSMHTLYDVGHNNAKMEEHVIEGKPRQVVVHRKGSTRAYGPGHPEVPELYRAVGQPVLVGGTMGTASYILRGTEKGMRHAWGSSIHGAGRKLSRQEAKKRYNGKSIIKEMKDQNIIVKGASLAGISEEAPGAYKDVDQVVDIVEKAGINKIVARTYPLLCIKG